MAKLIGNLYTRYICTKANPWDETKGKAVHPNAKRVADNDDYVDTYQCPDCGIRYKVEVAE